jgi:PPOX class probable F420-dependent enzyme
MTVEERRAFLSHGTRTGKLATVRASGAPHVAPIWFVLDGDDMVFTTAAASVKGRNLRRDPRAAMCVDDQAPPYSFVVSTGTVTLANDLDEMLRWATAIGARYMGEERAEAFGRRNAVPEEVLVRLTPTHFVAEADVSD